LRIGILGVGKLGLCFALNIEQKGFQVIGIDTNESYVSQLNNKSFYSFEPKVNELLSASKNFTASTDIKSALGKDINILFVMVATPSESDGSYNHEQIERIAQELIRFGKRTDTVHLVIGCTTMPGYCDTLAEKLESLNYTVNYNPEFIAQGSIIQNQKNPDQVLIGEANAEAGNAIVGVYEKMCENNPIFCRMSRLSAEIAKIATNCFLTTKISFANSIGDLAKKVGAEPEKILAAIGADSRIGNKYLQYGFGFGGPCFPRDNRALGHFAEQNGYELMISKATDNVNRKHLEFQFEDYMKQFSKEDSIVFDGITYKKGSTLLDESQQLKLAVLLANAGRRVMITDVEKVVDEVKSIYGNLFDYKVI
jgi:UDPglucose 6-dehydrogenase